MLVDKPCEVLLGAISKMNPVILEFVRKDEKIKMIRKIKLNSKIQNLKMF